MRKLYYIQTDIPAFGHYTEDASEIKSNAQCEEGFFITEKQLEARDRAAFEAGYEDCYRDGSNDPEDDKPSRSMIEFFWGQYKKKH